MELSGDLPSGDLTGFHPKSIQLWDNLKNTAYVCSEGSISWRRWSIKDVYTCIYIYTYPPVNVYCTVCELEWMAHRNRWFTKLQNMVFFYIANCNEHYHLGGPTLCRLHSFNLNGRFNQWWEGTLILETMAAMNIKFIEVSCKLWDEWHGKWLNGRSCGSSFNGFYIMLLYIN